MAKGLGKGLREFKRASEEIDDDEKELKRANEGCLKEQHKRPAQVAHIAFVVSMDFNRVI
mgnify:CR=1 FL=1